MARAQQPAVLLCVCQLFVLYTMLLPPKPLKRQCKPKQTQAPSCRAKHVLRSCVQPGCILAALENAQIQNRRKIVLDYLQSGSFGSTRRRRMSVA